MVTCVPDGDITTPVGRRAADAVSPAPPSRTIAAIGTDTSSARPTVYQASGSWYWPR